MTRLNLPARPRHSGDLLPFLRAGDLALIFPLLLVLLVEDNSTDSTVLGEQQSQLTSYQRRFVGLSEKEREWPTVRNRATMAILPSRGLPRVPSYGDPARSPPATVFQKGYLMRISLALPLFLILSMYPLSIYLADTRPHSPTTLAYESITHTSSIAATILCITRLIMHRHVRIAFFLSHLSTRLTIHHAFSLRFSPMTL